MSGYPIPDEAKTQPNFIEGGVPGGGTSGDRHLLIVDRDRWVLFELYATRWNARRRPLGSRVWRHLRSERRRSPARRMDVSRCGGPGDSSRARALRRSDERRDIRHALRVTVRSTNGYVWPASHRAGSTSGALPMGARLRLKASKDISGFPPDIQRIFRAMQIYGLIVADNGSDMYITGTMDAAGTTVS